MTEKATARKAHSEEYFGEYRDFWWNQDFLKLMGTRLKLDQVHTVLDAGSGVGHWGQLLASVLPKKAQLTGVDFEESSVAKATKRAEQQGLSNRYHYQVGDVTSLPFADETFDMVTCQTVLIHLKDPVAGLREMLRVLKPGGLILAAEPNNFSNRAVASNLTENHSVDEVMERMKFGLLIERGKKALGLGFNSEGDLVPGYLAQLEAEEIQVYLSDKSVPFFPPYLSAEQKANINQMRDWAAREFVGWDRDEMKKYYLAGGGDPAKFDYYWNQGLKDVKEAVQAIDKHKYHSAGGAITYLISARKKLNR